MIYIKVKMYILEKRREEYAKNNISIRKMSKNIRSEKRSTKMGENQNITENEKENNHHDQVNIRIKDKNVETIYRDCKIGKSLPIVFDSIAKTYNIDIYGTDFNYIAEIDKIKERIKDKGKVLGMVSVKNDRANVYYNNNEDIDIPLQRFVIAHEIGHCVYEYDELSREGMVEFANENDTDDEKEKLCDSFAMELLIPNYSVKYFYDNIKKPKIKDLANVFLVPEDKIKKRLEYLGYKVYK